MLPTACQSCQPTAKRCCKFSAVFGRRLTTFLKDFHTLPAKRRCKLVAVIKRRIANLKQHLVGDHQNLAGGGQHA